MELEAVLASGRALAMTVAVAAAAVLYAVGRLVLARLARPVYPMAEGRAERARRARSMVLRIWGYVVGAGLVVALLALLPRAGVVVLLVGVVGAVVLVAVQGLLRDVVAGLSILLEGQMGPGDRVRLFGVDVEGAVEDVGLRRTVLRTDDGSQVFVPNGSIDGVRVIPAGPDTTAGAGGEDGRRGRSGGRRRGGRRSRRGGRRDEGRSGTARADDGRSRGRDDDRRSGPKRSEGAEEEDDRSAPPRELLPESPWSIE